MTVAPVSAISPTGGLDALQGGPQRAQHGSFANMIFDGVEKVNQKLIAADQKAEAFALDDSIPPHDVLFALDEAHEAFGMMMQVRAKLVEGYQELMRMQL